MSFCKMVDATDLRRSLRAIHARGATATLSNHGADAGNRTQSILYTKEVHCLYATTAWYHSKESNLDMERMRLLSFL